MYLSYNNKQISSPEMKAVLASADKLVKKVLIIVFNRLIDLLVTVFTIHIALNAALVLEPLKMRRTNKEYK
jgi:hypothetical protein